MMADVPGTPLKVKAQFNQKASQLETSLERILVKQAPFQLPQKVREFIVRVTPWVTLTLLVLILPAILAIFTLSGAVGVFAPVSGIHLGFVYYLALIVLMVQGVIMAWALPGLFKRSRFAWRLLYYAALVNVIYDLTRWLAAPAAVFGLISDLVAALVGFYVLFQIKSHYRA